MSRSAMEMTYSNVRSWTGWIFTLILLGQGTVALAQDIKEAPANIQAAILTKILGFNETIAGGGDVTVVVIKSPELAEAMKPSIGRPIGDSKIANITAVDVVPKDKPAGLTVVYLGDAAQLEACAQYCRQHKVLSIAKTPDWIKKGLTLTVGVSEKKPKIVVNLTNTKEEGIEWNPAILKVASTTN